MARLVEHGEVHHREVDRVDGELAVQTRAVEKPLGDGGASAVLARGDGDDLKNRHALRDGEGIPE
jgi:hypothetical protein